MIQVADRKVPGAARMLGYGGVLPFLGLALIHAVGGPEAAEFASRGFLAYSAVILSFLGGIRWGLASRSDRFQAGALSISVVPSLWAFACLLLPAPGATAAGLLLGFALAGLADWLMPPPGSAVWMIGLRGRLTLAVIACHVIFIASLTAS